ncbi:hypothetical protein [Vogesella oryzae]|uniref:hypothetical protein n=1 Tax=Vogesella oryzae TaxID=1735285 RepID=UPI001582CBBE|nr:hypothetical protein [Vogesella oryzae]
MPRFRTLLLCCSLLWSTLAAAAIWRVGVDQSFQEPRLGIGFHHDQRALFAASSLPGLDSPELAGGQRTMLEILLLGRMLQQVDPQARIQLVGFPNIRRGMAMLVEGDIDVLGQTLFDGDVLPLEHELALEQTMLKSAPLIRRGEFEMGVFTTANRPEILGIRDAAAFQQLAGVTVDSWAGDLAIMQRVHPAQLHTVPRREQLAVMIANRRADFTFSFLTEAVVTRIGGKLVRIPGFKVSINDERAFYFSRERPELLRHMNALLAQLRQQTPDGVYAALVKARVVAPEFRQWVELGR